MIRRCLFLRLRIMDVYVNNSTDATFNLALEELVAKEGFSGSDGGSNSIMFWRNASAVIIGCNQITAAEIDADYIRENNIQVVRRITGGGAVYHDLGNINFTICVNDRQLSPEAFSQNAAVIIDALRKFGIAAEFSGRNDIIVNGRKISGSAKSVFKDRTLFHGTLLFDTDLEVLTSALKSDEKKIQSKGIKSIRSRVANIREFLPDWDREKFLDELIKTVCGNAGDVRNIPDKFIARAEELANTKYRTWEWNYGTNFTYSYQQSGRFAGGSVKVSFNIRDNRIMDCQFSGDFFGSVPVKQLGAALDGLPVRRDRIAEVLQKADVEQFIQGVTPDELITLFNI